MKGRRCTFRVATGDDTGSLAKMNRQLILDEGHRNSMTLPQLEERIRSWLAGEYQATVFMLGEADVGYALYRRDPEWIYLRQFFVRAEHRRNGVGAEAMRWLLAHPWKDAHRVRLDVLVGNKSGLEFWRAVGFREYCVTMERPVP